MFGVPVYSALCESSESAYFEYLSTCRDVYSKFASVPGLAGQLLECASGGVVVDVGELGRKTLASGLVASGGSVGVDEFVVGGVAEVGCGSGEVVDGVASDVAVQVADVDGVGDVGGFRVCGDEGVEVGSSSRTVVVRSGNSRKRNVRRAKASKKRKQELDAVKSELRQLGLNGVGGSGVKVAVKSELQLSLEAKWEAENKLAVKQAERKIALLDARDLEAEKKMQRAQIMRTTEAAKVQTERAYATLKRTGNVPGFAETVVTDVCPALSPSRSDGTCISPDSSVSQQEIRAMMKELEDYKLTMSRIERDNPALVAHHMEGHGVKTAFTLDSDGLCPVDEPGSMGVDGKYHLDSYEPNPRFYKDRFRAEEFAEKYFGS